MKIIQEQELGKLIFNKLTRAGLSSEHASVVSDSLVHADLRGVHSHGAMRVQYYVERLMAGGININPVLKCEHTGPSAIQFYGDEGFGTVVAQKALDVGIETAKTTGVAIVGVKCMSHAGALSYFTEQAAQQNMIALSLCQSDPMVAPFGGAEPFYGTNPLAFSVPSDDGMPVTIDMATSIQAWGKVLDARSKNNPIPNDWAVDTEGKPTTDPHAVRALMPIAGPKGYGLAFMIDVLSGMLLNLPFGSQISSMYNDLSEYRHLGHMHIIINPEFFAGLKPLLNNVQGLKEMLHAIKPAAGFDQVMYPGEPNQLSAEKYRREGIPIADSVVSYLTSDTLNEAHVFGNRSAFAS